MSKLQFAVVREDPEVESAIWRTRRPERALLVVSGGCTILTLAGRFPGARIVGTEPNPAQLAHFERRVEALARGDAELARQFNVGSEDRTGLSVGGRFEALFRSLSAFVRELANDGMDLLAWFEGAESERVAGVRRSLASPYWRLAFEAHFSDASLEAMFTSAATQHAEPGSYAAYFRRRLEAALLASDAPRNRFLHHLFLGRYLAHSPPPYLGVGDCRDRIETRADSFEDIEDYAPFDFIGLSNVMDWMPREAIEQLQARIRATAPRGCRVLWRQLNNQRDLATGFGPGFQSSPQVDARLAALESSAFYERVHLVEQP